MAVWDYRCTIVPEERVQLLASLRPETVSDIDSLGLWTGTPLVRLLSLFPQDMPMRMGWTEKQSVLQVGPNLEVRIWAEGAEVYDVELRIDLRREFVESLTHLISLCARNRWMLFDDMLRLFPPSLDPVLESIQGSPAAEFVRDPSGYLTGRRVAKTDGTGRPDGEMNASGE